MFPLQRPAWDDFSYVGPGARPLQGESRGQGENVARRVALGPISRTTLAEPARRAYLSAPSVA